MPETLPTVDVGGPWEEPDPDGVARGYRQSTGQGGHHSGDRLDSTRRPRGSAAARPPGSGETSKVSLDFHQTVISSLLMPSRFQAEKNEIRVGILRVTGDQSLGIALVEELTGMITMKDQANTKHDPGLLPPRKEQTVGRYARRMIGLTTMMEV
jgi:hypothetical protein